MVLDKLKYYLTNDGPVKWLNRARNAVQDWRYNRKMEARTTEKMYPWEHGVNIHGNQYRYMSVPQRFDVMNAHVPQHLRGRKANV
jgi:hypothetical protein